MNRHRPWPSREACLDALREGDGEGVTVAVLDTGVDPRHPDFAALRFAGAWTVAMHGAAARIAPAEPLDPVGHGTAIAGIIHRMAPAAEILSVSVLGGDQRQHRHELIHEGALFAIRHGAALLNCSFGVPGTHYTLPLYRDWTDRAFRAGCCVVAASSNDDPDLPEWPAFLSHVLGVAAIDCAPGGFLCDPSHPVPLRAAGAGIRVPAPGGGHTTASGSSFAAAHATGMLARVMSRFPGLPPAFAREALLHLAQQGTAPANARPV